LGQLLQKLNIGTSKDRLEILSLTKSQQYQLACTKHFQVAHPDAASRSDVTLDNVGNHPNAWFRASVAYHKSSDKEEGDTNRPKAVVSPEK
jgi:DNA primase large subunit